jgi:hypothetical protein
MNWLKTITHYYERGYYVPDPTKKNYVGIFVMTGKITEEEFTELTGNPYLPPTGI